MKEKKESLNFIEEIIDNDLKEKKYDHIVTRFPPEPNGYLHIGHASAICFNFGLTKRFPGYTNLRFDDTNPTTEETEYVESIKKDIQWLGFQWENEFYASDYFDKMYEFAVVLIKKGLAYVDDSTSEEIATQKGSPTRPGIPNQYRSRSIEENLELFESMKNGVFADGSKILRAKIDMEHTNMLMRDPILYRIKKAHHHRTGDKWCIYPMYDFAHGQSDSIENITHSICTMEFIPHRELYNWLIAKLEIFPSHQYEFARRNINYTVTSKRKLLQLVNEKIVNGWDDPRMPTISGMRRRGYPAASLREFCNRIGIAKRENVVDVSLLEFCVREELNRTSQRIMAVLDPLKVVITNFPDGEEILLPIDNNPENENGGTREVPFGRELWIEKSDFMEDPPKKYFRLSPGNIVRLKGAFIIQCDSVDKDTEGNILQVNCTYFENSKSGNDQSGLHPKGTLHWLSKLGAVTAECRIYDRLFSVEEPDSDKEVDFKSFMNPNSLSIIPEILIEKHALNFEAGSQFQFLRHGYFVLDTASTKEYMIFNRTVTLKDTWAKAN
jgi:glutaminyl-tRNA synthetase